MIRLLRTILVLLAVLAARPAHAGYMPFNTASSGNIGIGTTTPQGGFVVMNGNVGIGTWLPANTLDVKGVLQIDTTTTGTFSFIQLTSGTTEDTKDLLFAQKSGATSQGFQFDTRNGAGSQILGMVIDKNGNVGIGTGLTAGILDVEGTTAQNVIFGGLESGPVNVGIGTATPQGALTVMSGNVGIGSVNPGQALDVTGTIRTTGFTMSGAAPAANYVLTATDSAGDTAWVTPGTIGSNYWNYSASGNIGLSTTAAVGVGTTFVGGSGEGALSIMNGNVGIGTWVPANNLDVNGGIDIKGVNGISFPIVDSTADASIAIGINAMLHTPSSAAYGDVAIGYNALAGTASTTSASTDNTAVGHYASWQLTTGANDTTIGYNAGYAITTGSGIVAIGERAGNGVSSGTDNTAVGTGSQNEGNGSYNTSLGYLALGSASFSGSGDTAIGNNTGDVMTSGSNNVEIGQNVGIGTLTTGSNNILIGTDASTDTLTGNTSNTLNIGNTIYGINMYNLTNTSGAGNIGIGTFNPFGGRFIVTGGNVGIGSLVPGQALDVTGTIRTTGLTMSGQAPAANYVLTATDSAGDASWTAPGNVSAAGWTQTGSEIYTTTNSNNVGIGTAAPTGFEIESHNVGIGTAFTGGAGEGALTVMNGNVGIGTWVPVAPLTLGTGGGEYVLSLQNGNPSAATGVDIYNGNGMLTIAYGANNYASIGDYGSYKGLIMASGSGMGFSSNTAITGGNFAADSGFVRQGVGQVITTNGSVGIGTFYAGAIGIGTNASSAYVETAIPVGNMIVQGNVGIGTTITSFAGLSVMNGNVGIGTWVPAYNLDVGSAGNGTYRGRVVYRVTSTSAPGATPSVDTDNDDIFEFTGLNANITSISTSGSPRDGDIIEIIFTDNGTSRSITWGASFTGNAVTLPIQTTASTELRVYLQYDGTNSVWVCQGVA